MSERAPSRLARTLRRHGLGVPAAILLDAHRPLAPLIADLSAAYGPLADILGGRPVTDVREVVEDPDGLDRLAQELDATPSRGPRAGTG